MYKREQENTYSIKEIGAVINNALQAAVKPASGPINEKTLQRLRRYSQELIKPLKEHLTGGVDEIEGPFEACMDPEEMVVILLSAALYFHLTFVAKTDKVPQAAVVEALFKEDPDEGR